MTTLLCSYPWFTCGTVSRIINLLLFYSQMSSHIVTLRETTSLLIIGICDNLYHAIRSWYKGIQCIESALSWKKCALLPLLMQAPFLKGLFGSKGPHGPSPAGGSGTGFFI